MVLIVHRIVSLLPLNVMSGLGTVTRSFVRFSLLQQNGFRIHELSPNVECISFGSNLNFDLDELLNCKVIVYLHGGGFFLRDSVDLIIAERLLPLLKEQLTVTSKQTVIVSVLYPLSTQKSVQKDATSNNEIMLDFILKAMDLITERSSGICAIVGDSAGGYLALQASKFHQNARLCLISPFLDLKMRSNSFERNKNTDFLDLKFLARCRNQFLSRGKIFSYEKMKSS